MAFFYFQNKIYWLIAALSIMAFCAIKIFMPDVPYMLIFFGMAMFFIKFFIPDSKKIRNLHVTNFLNLKGIYSNQNLADYRSLYSVSRQMDFFIFMVVIVILNSILSA